MHQMRVFIFHYSCTKDTKTQTYILFMCTVLFEVGYLTVVKCIEGSTLFFNAFNWSFFFIPPRRFAYQEGVKNRSTTTFSVVLVQSIQHQHYPDWPFPSPVFCHWCEQSQWTKAHHSLFHCHPLRKDSLNIR